VAPPPHEEGFSSFYSLEFMRNAIDYARRNFAAWREVRLSRNNMRTRVFRWRLLDFEYIVPAILERYPNSYLSDVELACAVEEVGEATLDEEYMQVPIAWRCIGSFEGQDRKRISFLSNDATMKTSW
jgi:hypothetical protein